ncbi:MAG: NADH-quinone oxidoreductase subunit J [bacterium]
MTYLTMAFLILFAVLAILLPSTLMSVLSLAAVSALLSIVFFQLGAPVAGVFELSVGAGLITVLAVLTISFIQARKVKKQVRTELWIVASFAAAALFFFIFNSLSPWVSPSSVPPVNWGAVGEVLWRLRAFDLLPQALVILSAVLGILVLLRPEKGETP